MTSQPAPTRTLPANPSLSQLRKQAKELLKAYRAGDVAAATEIGRFERFPDAAEFHLVDAQRILARAYGFSNWASVKEYVDGVNVEHFCVAAMSGDVATVRKLARARPDLVNRERGGLFGETTALHYAILNRDSRMTHALMELGANAHAGIWPHRDATTAKVLASERGYSDIVAIIEQAEARRRKEMSSAGAPVSSITDDIHQALLKGRGAEAIQLLESDPLLVGASNRNGSTPLHAAAWTHDRTMVAWLLEHGAPPHARMPLDLADWHLQTDAVGRTPLDLAAIGAGWAADGQAHPFMENATKDLAAFHDTVQLLRAAGAELTPRAAVAIGDTAAVWQLHRDGRLSNEIHTLRGGLISIAVRVNCRAMVCLLLDLGLDPNETVIVDGRVHSWGMPLWFAAMCGRFDIAELLLQRGADVNAVVYACGDALSMAADEKMEALLRRHGAHLTVEQVHDLQTAREILNGSLPAYSLNVDEPTLTDLAEQMLWAAGGDPDFVELCLPHVPRKRDDPWWNYVLLHARQPEGFQRILESGVDPDVRDGGGCTMLHHLAAESTEDSRLKRATLLLDAGASLTKRDALLKSTPLGWACRWGRLELTRLYLARGALVAEPDAEPWATPMAWAARHGHHAVLELLRTAAR